MFRNPAYAALKADPIIRQTVACEWVDDVQGEAADDYANAVAWTLKQSPAVLKDDKWREDFFQNVVQPLQRIADDLMKYQPMICNVFTADTSL
ncbi:hypothetical protein LTR09_010823 [Extremus antarcticus]|uniref:Uncharacterized protein n=1 Tax=Extremus antarcticus TaxID=702011 RepID=A0AAJ0DD94_9PEZI|nr:hypothetical protein LTR09_010823 [Extremus antarcticus]